jgi:hypothetical protein
MFWNQDKKLKYHHVIAIVSKVILKAIFVLVLCCASLLLPVMNVDLPAWLEAPDALAVSSFRVTEYYLTTGDFTGTTYDLTLDQDLADDYFILVRGAKEGNGASDADNDNARVAEVPGGTGELADSGASDAIVLSRYIADVTWEGVVTVVECILDCDASGFELIDIVETPIANGETSGSDTSTAWSDINQVVLFGGFKGGGAEFDQAAASNDDNATQTRLYPTGTNTLNWTRDTDSDTATDAVTLTTFVVEWGSEWTVQHVDIQATIGTIAGCDDTSEYQTAAITSVARANTWVWGTGISNEEGIGDTAEGTIVTLGNGVDQNANESLVSWCGEYASTRHMDIYTMTHPDFLVDYRFKADGDGSFEDLPVAVDAATDGFRFAWVTASTNGSGSAQPRERFWARYSADTIVTVSHGYTGQDWPAWVNGVDFSGISLANDRPAITLTDIPFAFEQTGDATPDFEFSASDPDGSADIVYQIQIDDDRTFASPLVDCESDTACTAGAGTFTNTTSGGDTDPFNEGDTIRFTPTTAMSSGTTYYWRVRAEDVAAGGGSGFYGDWSTRRSLTYVSGTSPSAWHQTTSIQFDSGTLADVQASIGSGNVSLASGYSNPSIETGRVTIDDSLNWTTITLARSYDTPPVVLVTPVTANNCEAAGACVGNSTTVDTGGKTPIPVVRNVTVDDFDISMCIDGGAAACETSALAETFDWFVFDIDTAEDYDWIEVGTRSSVPVDGSTTGVTYTTSFVSTPAVWTQAQTYLQGGNMAAHAWVDPKSLSGFSFVGCVISSTSDNDCLSSAIPETFGYVAIDTTNENFPGSANFQSGFANISASQWTAASFSPSFTNPRVMVTVNSETGGEDPQYAMARNVTGSGMEYRFCEQDGGTICNTHNAEETRWFAIEEASTVSSGTIMSPEIDYDLVAGVTSWNEVSFSTTETEGDVKLSIYYTDSTACDTIIPDLDLAGNSSGFDASGGAIDISGLNTTTYNRICLQATLADSGGSPTLNDWTVTWSSASGTLSVDIVDGAGTSVASPSLAMSSTTVSFASQTATGILGVAAEKIRVTNTTLDEQWALSIAASSTTALWAGSSESYDFNDSSGATDGGDTDSVGGQLTIDPSGMTITPESGCTTTGLSSGSSDSFEEESTDSITLLTAGVSTLTDCYWDVTDIDLSQVIPGEQPTDTYTIEMTLTVIAI